MRWWNDGKKAANKDSKTVAGIMDTMMDLMNLLPSEVNKPFCNHFSTG